MATTVDVARTAGVGGDYNTAYQGGNDHADTPDPTWLTAVEFAVGTAETEIPPLSVAVTPVNNTLNAWLPAMTTTFLGSTPATTRF